MPRYLMTYFITENENGIYLAESDDGVHFKPQGKLWEDRSTRDPAIARIGDAYYLIWSQFGASASVQLPVLRSADARHWESYTTISPDLSAFPHHFVELWAPEFFVDNDGTVWLTFAAKFQDEDGSSGVCSMLMPFDDATLQDYAPPVRVTVPEIPENDMYDLTLCRDGNRYLMALHSIKSGAYNETPLYTAPRPTGPYTRFATLPNTAYIEGMTILKDGDTICIWGDEAIPDPEKHLMLYRTTDFSHWTADNGGLNFRHPKIICCS